MTNIISNQILYDIMPTISFSGECARSESAEMEVGQVYKSSLPVEHRVKPDNLLSSFTNRGPQTTLVQSVRHSTYQTSGWDFCNGRWARVPKIYHYYGMPNPPGIDTSQFPDWAGPLRLKMQADKVSLAESIGEWRESVHAVRTATQTVGRGIKSARSMLRSPRNVRSLRKWFNKTIGRAPDSRLELRDAISVDLALKFGIKPQIQLIEDSMATLGRVQVLRRRHQVTVTDRNQLLVPSPMGGSLILDRTLSCRAIAYVTYNINDSSFTSGNLAESLWAGTSLSFMVDWFWNVGSYLSSFNAMNGVTSIRGVVTSKAVQDGVDNRLDAAGGVIIKPGRVRNVEISRQAFSGLSAIPNASIPTPRLPEGDLGRLWSAIEVLLSIRKS